MKTIIFISGIFVPKFVGKSSLIWNDKIWENYNRIYVSSTIPTSNKVVEKELDSLASIVRLYDKPILAGQSLGGWWAANLATHRKISIDKLILFTPMCESNSFPLFDYTNHYNPCELAPVISGPHKVLVFPAYYDNIVPIKQHANKLIKHFNAMDYLLSGDHWYQADHLAGLKFAQEWIEI